MISLTNVEFERNIFTICIKYGKVPECILLVYVLLISTDRMCPVVPLILFRLINFDFFSISLFEVLIVILQVPFSHGTTRHQNMLRCDGVSYDLST